MRFLEISKDGGPESPVEAYWLIEWKSVFSIALLKFNRGMRESFHNHAFNAFTWFLWGDLVEEDYNGKLYNYYFSLFPKLTKRSKLHRVKANQDSWCLTIRGPWSEYWNEVSDDKKTLTKLTNGRKVIDESDYNQDQLAH